MRTLRRVVFIAVAIIIVLVAIAYLLPQRVQVARSTDIAAPPSVVFPLVANLREAQKWSPWLGIDPNIKVTYDGEVGIGQTMSWNSEHPRVGRGSQTITAYEPESKVVTALDFGEQGTAIATTIVEPQGDNASRVTWGFETDLGMNPVARYFGLAMEAMIAPDYEKGLAKLKEVSEAETVAAPTPQEPDVTAPDAPLAPDSTIPESAATPDSTTP